MIKIESCSQQRSDEEVSTWQSRKEKCPDRDVIRDARPTGSSRLPRPNCGEFVLPHNACKACGKYRGRDVIAVD